jgi:hypothetical protein|tara:strand:- start:944 stop:1180 length:237 start_codon:yes stop_codon:yes gene_type:complete
MMNAKLEQDIQTLKRYKANPVPHSTMAKAYIAIMNWKLNGILPDTAEADDDDIIAQMEGAYRQWEQEKDAQAQMGEGE